jgi:cold shock CspA family protein
VPVVVHADAALPSIVRASFVMPDGLGHYYHRNSVLDGGFESLEVGSEVRFAEEQGAEGAQASTVTPVRRRRGGAACRPSSS